LDIARPVVAVKARAGRRIWPSGFQADLVIVDDEVTEVEI